MIVYQSLIIETYFINECIASFFDIFPKEFKASSRIITNSYKNQPYKAY